MRLNWSHRTARILLPPLALTIGLSAPPARADAPAAPQSPDPAVKVALFAEAPDIVTPIGATVDSRGRLLVIESNSHFRPKDYQGPATDRIRILQDTKGAGKADRFTTFFEGMNFLMNLSAGRDGSVVVSSRDEIFRLSDADGGGERKVTLAHLETKNKYPHDGLDGLAVDAQGNVYFGMGENLGAPWTLIGSDGKSLQDDKGSGSVFRADAKGGGLVRLARGLWNPFGLGFDPNGTLWAIDNDPDGRPPSRLLHVVPGADYGFQFRYGRTGLHPLQAWDGELPGTLGMVSGVGEAPCNVVWHDGRLFVSSWRDHLVQAFTLIQNGASYRASMQPILTGGPDFRPVGLAFAPDGTLYVTDWGSASYEINRKGRVWRVTFGRPAADTPPPHNDAMSRADRLRRSNDIADLTAGLEDQDPFIREAAGFGLSQLPETGPAIKFASLRAPEARVAALAGLLLRGGDMSLYVPAALHDPDVRVREMGVRLVTEQNIKSARDELEGMLDSPVMSPRLLGMIVAAIAQLDGDPAARVNSSKVDQLLLGKLNSPKMPDASKATLLRMLPPERGAVNIELLRKLMESKSPVVQLEAVRSLSEMADPARLPLLAQLAESGNFDLSVRTAAVVGLGADPSAHVDLLLRLAEGDVAPLRDEALRSLRAVATKLDAAQRASLEKIARQHPPEAGLVDRLLGRPAAPRPAETDLAAWDKILDQQPGDPEAGRRIFFHPSGPACYRCHIIEGRGRAIGPDLSMIGHSQQRSHILESILQPSREIAPLYTMWSIRLKNGRQVDGMLLRRDGQENEIYVDASGQETLVKEPEVTDRKLRPESLMPAGLVQALTDQELRDLMALLTQKR